MTNETFTLFLEEKEILFNGRPANRDDFAICKGWLALVSSLMEELLSTGWDGNVLDCKEKQTSLRFETEPQQKMFDCEPIEKYRIIAMHICPICGRVVRHDINLEYFELFYCENCTFRYCDLT